MHKTLVFHKAESPRICRSGDFQKGIGGEEHHEKHGLVVISFSGICCLCLFFCCIHINRKSCKKE